MATYKPQVKQANGTMADLNLDAATLNGKAESALSVSYATSAGSANAMGEEKLSWGPVSTSVPGAVSPVGMSLSQEHSANRLAFINPNAITVEKSDDDGATWTEVWNTDDTKKFKSRLCTTSEGVKLGTQTNCTVKSRARITITGRKSENEGYLYTNPKKLLINVTNAGTMFLKVETRTGANMLSGGAWSNYNNGNYYSLSGWSGWNDIPIILGTLGGGWSQTSNIWQLRLTFFVTAINATYPSVETINSLRLFGENAWTVIPNMAKTGHLYSYDDNQNATFPADVKATTFKKSDGTEVSYNGHTHTSVQYATKLETYKAGSQTETYGQQYPVYAQWLDRTHVKLKCNNYTTVIDSAVSDEVGNNIQSTYAKKSSLATVATSGSYNDLTNKPTIVSQVKVGDTAYNPVNGVVSLPAYPTPSGGGKLYKHTIEMMCTMSMNFDEIRLTYYSTSETAFNDVPSLFAYLSGVDSASPTPFSEYKKQIYPCFILDTMGSSVYGSGTAAIYYDPNISTPMGMGDYVMDYVYVNGFNERAEELGHITEDFMIENMYSAVAEM